ncbi:MAG: PorT family protein [Hymenobacteraceae bacterium]|nr:PorT family protein [Hymenobacteraceae bacterium]
MKQALPFLIFFLSINLLAAQTLPGLRIGGSYSKINGISTTKGSYNWQQSAHGGLFIMHKIGDKLYMQPELLYSQKGYRYKIDRNNKGVYGDTVKYQEKNRIDYLELPLLVKLQAKGVYFEAGPQFSFFLNGERTETRTTVTNGTVDTHQSRRNLHRLVEGIDIGFAGGLGYQFESGLGLGARFNQSFKELIDEENWKKLITLQASAFYVLGKRRHALNAAPAVPPAIPAPDVEYFDKRKASTKGYQVISKMNINRVTFTKVADSKQLQVEYKIISTGGFLPQDVMLAGSSGSIMNSGMFMVHREVAYPFQGSVQFTTPATAGTNDLLTSRMEYEIKEPGHWRITITVSR